MKSRNQVSLKTGWMCALMQLVAVLDRQLGSQPRQRVDGAVWRRHRTDHEVRGAAGELPCSVLRQRCASCEYSDLDHAATDFVSVPQTVEGAVSRV